MRFIFIFSFIHFLTGISVLPECSLGTMDMSVPSKAGAHIGTGVTDALEAACAY